MPSLLGIFLFYSNPSTREATTATDTGIMDLVTGGSLPLLVSWGPDFQEKKKKNPSINHCAKSGLKWRTQHIHKIHSVPKAINVNQSKHFKTFVVSLYFVSLNYKWDHYNSPTLNNVYIFPIILVCFICIYLSVLQIESRVLYMLGKQAIDPRVTPRNPYFYSETASH